MFIKRAELKGFKRFRFSNINTLEVDFTDPVQIITARNGYGKSSLLRELSPLPCVRSDYDPGGYRVLHIEHENKSYKLTSDFTNKSSPHSFIVDDVELNVSGNKDIQTELVEKHFKVTPSIRDLVYAKTKLCSCSPSDRKNLFLNINPMELGLILDTHKKALSRLRYYKDNLQHLYARKNDLEGQMIPSSQLAQHNLTKDIYNKQLLDIDKLLYSIDQHISNMRIQYSDIIESYDDNRIINTELPSEYLELEDKLNKWAFIPRDDLRTYQESLSVKSKELATNRQSISSEIHKLRDEIDEYDKHIKSSTSRPLSNIEKSIQEVSEEMNKYTDLPDNPLPVNLFDKYYSILDRLDDLLIVFRDFPGTLIPVSEIGNMYEIKISISGRMESINRDMSRLIAAIDDINREISNLSTKAGMPSDCQHVECGLSKLYRTRMDKVINDKSNYSKEHKELSDILEKLKIEYIELCDKYKPFEEYMIVSRYTDVKNILSDNLLSTLDNWDDNLFQRLKNQPIRIYEQIREYLTKSKEYHRYIELKSKHDQLVAEMKLILESKGTSIEFLKNIITTKESLLKEKIKELDKVDYEINIVDRKKNHFKDYTNMKSKVDKSIVELRELEDQLTVIHTIHYLQNLTRTLREVKGSINEDFGELTILVKHQETIRSTYDNEIMKNIELYEKERYIFSKVETALSPTTGMPHKSMVTYLNALIHNVNSFVSRIWSYKLRILELDMNKPVDYLFKVDVGSETVRDISQLSDGQQEVMNIAWVLTILLQLKLLDKVPFFADEIGRTFDATHRNKIFSFLGNLIDHKVINQMFIVNHFAMYTDGFKDSEILCLSREDLSSLPSEANKHSKMS